MTSYNLKLSPGNSINDSSPISLSVHNLGLRRVVRLVCKVGSQDLKLHLRASGATHQLKWKIANSRPLSHRRAYPLLAESPPPDFGVRQGVLSLSPDLEKAAGWGHPAARHAGLLRDARKDAPFSEMNGEATPPYPPCNSRGGKEQANARFARTGEAFHRNPFIGNLTFRL